MCKIHGMHVIVGTLPKLGFTPLYYKNTNKICVYNSVIHKLSVEMNFSTCDMSGVEVDYIDNVHFTNKGHKEIAKRWARKILSGQT